MNAPTLAPEPFGCPVSLQPHPEERDEASRLEGCLKGRRPLGAYWSVLRGRFAAPQDEEGWGPTLKADVSA